MAVSCRVIVNMQRGQGHTSSVEGGDKMMILILLVLLLEGAVFWGMVKIFQLVACEEDEKSEKSNQDHGTDFWLNIISYDHKKKGGDKN